MPNPIEGPGQPEEHPPRSFRGNQRRLLLLGVLGLGLAALIVWFQRETWTAMFEPTDRERIERILASFDYEPATIDTELIYVGNATDEGIPALNAPRFIAAEESSFLSDNDWILGVEIDGKARAYPRKILAWHEVVNDKLGGIPLAVTYCPLCDSAVVIDRRSREGLREFSASGLLYNNNVLLESQLRGEERGLWSQMKTQGVTGNCAKIRLKSLPLEYTTWADWRSRHPATDVLSPQTGFDRDYSVDPYADYHQSIEEPMMPTIPGAPTNELFRKHRVLGIWSEADARAWAISPFQLRKSNHAKTIHRTIGGKKVEIAYNPEDKVLRVIEADEGLEWMYAYWFAWYAFFPHTELFESPDK